MNQSFNEYLMDAFINRGIRLSKVEAALVKESATIIWNLFDDLIGAIAKKNWSVGDVHTRLARLQSLRKQVTKILADGYADMDVINRSNAMELARKEMIWLGDTVNGALGIDILEVTLNKTVLKALANDSLIQGAPSAAWWEKQSTDLLHKFTTEMSMGIMQGETLDELTARIRGTKANAFKDGIMSISLNQAEALIRTSAQQVLNDARMSVYQDNADVLQGIMSHATLDLRTSPVCRAYDGAMYDTNFNPTGGNDLPYLATPRHFNCRSTHIPIVMSYEQLAKLYGGDTKYGRMLDRMNKSTRASMDGQVPSTMTYSDWLTKKNETNPKAVESLLGPSRYELWNVGKLSLADMIDSKGDLIPLDYL